MSGGGWDRQEPSVFDLGELQAPLMEHPVVAVAEQDQVAVIRVASVRKAVPR
jgi:hypothetical protein